MPTPEANAARDMVFAHSELMEERLGGDGYFVKVTLASGLSYVGAAWRSTQHYLRVDVGSGRRPVFIRLDQIAAIEAVYEEG